MVLKPIWELGVDEAHEILTRHFGLADLPPLEAIENEDWGRDALLSKFLEIPEEQLAEVGLSRSDLARSPAPGADQALGR